MTPKAEQDSYCVECAPVSWRAIFADVNAGKRLQKAIAQTAQQTEDVVHDNVPTQVYRYPRDKIDDRTERENGISAHSVH